MDHLYLLVYASLSSVIYFLFALLLCGKKDKIRLSTESESNAYEKIELDIFRRLEWEKNAPEATVVFSRTFLIGVVAAVLALGLSVVFSASQLVTSLPWAYIAILQLSKAFVTDRRLFKLVQAHVFLITAIACCIFMNRYIDAPLDTLSLALCALSGFLAIFEGIFQRQAFHNLGQQSVDKWRNSKSNTALDQAPGSPASIATTVTMVDNQVSVIEINESLGYASCLLGEWYCSKFDAFYWNSIWRPVTTRTMPALPLDINASRLVKSLRCTRHNLESRSLLFQLFWEHRISLLHQTLIRVLYCAVYLSISIVLKYLLKAMADTERPTMLVYKLACAFGVACVLKEVLRASSCRLALKMVVKLQAALMTELAAKTGRVKATEEEDVAEATWEKVSARKSLPINIGSLQNILTEDIPNIASLAQDINFVFADVPILFSVPCWLIWQQVGGAVFYGIAVTLALFALKIVITCYILRWYQEKKKLMDSRVAIASQIFNQIKFIKFFSLGDRFADLTTAKRNPEMDRVYQIRNWQSLEFATLWKLRILMCCAILMAHVVVYHGALDSSTIFFVASATATLCDPLNYFALVASYGPLVWVALKRLEIALKAPETSKFDKVEEDTSEMKVQQFSGSWNTPGSISQFFSLRDISLKFETGIHILTGPVSSGKSSLLLALLKEMDGDAGLITAPAVATTDLASRKRTAYCAQSAFMVSGTIRENILFGSLYEETRYKAVLDACALRPDLAIMQHGDLTEVGASGQRTSGGQRQRIALAWAVYSQASILLLDDVLSAVDAGSAKHICDRLFGGPLVKGRTIVLVSYYSPVLKYAKNVVSMNQGQVVSVTSALQSRLEASPTKLQFGNEGEDVLVTEAAEEDNLYQDEVSAVGKVKSTVYKSLAQAFGGFWPVSVAVVTCLLVQLMELWSFLLLRSLGSTESQPERILRAYSVLSVVMFLCDWFRLRYTLLAGVKASNRLFNKFLTGMLSARLEWLEATPVARLLQRSSTDQSLVDLSVFSRTMFLATDVSYCLVFGPALVIFLPAFAVPALIYIAFTHYAVKHYINLVQDLKRFESASRSPLVTYISEVFAGRVTYRAYGKVDQLLSKATILVEDFLRPQFNLRLAAFYLHLRFSIINGVLSGMIALWCVKTGQTAATTGFALTSILEFCCRVFWACSHQSDLNVELTSAERILDYINSVQAETTAGDQAPAAWPSSDASIVVKNLSMRYRPDLPLVLKNVSFTIAPKERIAIVGRTGSGKSTLAQAFFRFLECDTGSIRIDGLDIAQLTLKSLREKLTILPQDASLFENSLRFNLDPFDRSTDAELWAALKAVNLAGKSDSRIKSLDLQVLENGSNFSAGEKQLVALARGLVRMSSSALVILDEASASLDHETDAIIQKTIRKEITGSLLCIAHRLNTVADFDRVICLNQGRIEDLDTPFNLLNNPQSIFYTLAKDSGEFDELYRIAQEAHESILSSK